MDCGGGAMVPVGDVGARDGFERAADGVDRARVVDAPHGVPHPVVAPEGAERFLRADTGGDIRQAGGAAVGQKDRARLGFERLDVVDAVALFLGAGGLVPLHGPVEEGSDRAEAHEARLRPAAHLEAVEVVRRGDVLDEGPVGEAGFEKLARLGVDVVGVYVVVGGELGLGPVDVEKRQGPPLDGDARLGTVEHVVGQRGHLAGQLGGGADAGEGINAHGTVLSV